MSKAYGQLFDPNSTSVTVWAEYHPITFNGSGPTSGLSLSPSTGEVTLEADGDYLVLFSGSVEINTTATEVDIKLFQNGSEVGPSAWIYLPSVSNSVPGAYPTVSFNCILSGSASDVLVLKVTAAATSKVVAFETAQFSVVKIG